MEQIFGMIAKGRQDKVLKYLTSHPNAINIRNSDGETLLAYAVSNQKYSIVKAILKHRGNCYVASQIGMEALFVAASLGDAKTAQYLLKHKVWRTQEDLQQAMLCALYNNHHTIVPVLQSYGAIIGLIEAIYMGNKQLVESYLAMYPNTNVCYYGYPPLVHAIKAFALLRIAMVEILLRHKAEVDFRCANGQTALMEAVDWKEERYVELLLSHGASPDLFNEAGESALTKSERLGDEKLFMLVKSYSKSDA